MITGTDTGVGKTLVTAALARCLHERGNAVGVMKPVETGYPGDDPSQSDSAKLQVAAQTSDPIEVVSPYRFAAPLAPRHAGELEGRTISFDTIVEAYQRLASGRDFILVEGVGGVMVPLGPGQDVRDLMVRLQLPVLVVGRVALGGVNHARLTVEALSSVGMRIMALVLNQTRRPTKDTEREQERSTVQLLRGTLSLPVLDPLRFCGLDSNDWERAVAITAAEPAITGLANLLAP